MKTNSDSLINVSTSISDLLVNLTGLARDTRGSLDELQTLHK